MVQKSLTITALSLLSFSVMAQETEDQTPSAELIIEAERDVLTQPALFPGEEPLPPLDENFPDEENLFGPDLFNTGEAYQPSSEAIIPLRTPLLEDPQEVQRKMRIKFRKIKAVLEREPRLSELKQMVTSAPTPEDYRAAQRAYYALFFDQVRHRDKSLSQYADSLEEMALATLYQTRIEPTVALASPPDPQPQARFIPEPEYPLNLTVEEETTR